MKKKNCSFTKTMHHGASQSQRWQNYINFTLNCFHTNPFLLIWPPAITGCLQISKECSKTFGSNGKEISETEAYFVAKDTRFPKDCGIAREALYYS